KVGSANMSNRSLGLDTECDLVVEAGTPGGRPGADPVSVAIAQFRTRLVAEHLGLTPRALEGRLAAAGSLGAAIEASRGRPRTLEPLPESTAPAIDLAGLEGLVGDPERPIAPDKLMEQFVPEPFKRPARRS